ncbi:hypothetical protein [Leptodesmis sp.]|uniref:hypothetical protein n=1 Tax=Leptodesmis sp. TaxID=3100501 RepID=UPI0040534CE6
MLKTSSTRYTVGIAALSSLIVAALPLPSQAAKDSQDDFRRCVAGLQRANISAEEAVSACSRALNPQYLESCVVDISRNSAYSPGDALNACRQVRRPEDMAACVVSIRNSLKAGTAADILDGCRRSLLPVRYARCVVGLSQGSSGLSPTTALNSCNDELYFPREVDPTFISYPLQTPYPSLQPETPIQPLPTPVTPTPQPQTPAPATPAPVRGLY